MVVALQQNITNNKLVLRVIQTDEDIETIIKDIKNKDFESFRKNVLNLPNPETLFSEIYKRINEFDITKRPQITILVAKYSYQDAFVRDRIVNVVALGAEIMQLI
jgi:hypothetical protein